MKIKAQDKIGKLYGRLVPIYIQPYRNKWGKAIFLCKCIGPHEPKYVNINDSNLGRSTLSCGCYGKEQAIKYNTQHGHNKWKYTSKTYNTWRGMIERCYNSNSKSFGLYGGNGRFVCRRWRTSFTNFLKDMGERPEGKTLDRIDNNGPYGPWNCKWSDKFEQARNHSNKRLNKDQVIEIKRLLTETNLYLKEIAEQFGISIGLVSAIKQERIWRDVKWV